MNVDGEGERWIGSDCGLFWKENVYEYGKTVKTNVFGVFVREIFHGNVWSFSMR